jgi:hypothetical protein
MFKKKKINYSKHLNARQKEIYNFQKIASQLADYGFNCIKLADDWQGADFLACHINGATLKVQLKGRITIDKKYEDKNLYIAFPSNHSREEWYLIKHDKLVELIKKEGKWTRTTSWKKGSYSAGKVSKSMIKNLEKYKL